MSSNTKAAKQLSAKRIRTRNNVIVYIILSILAFIWLFPVAWIIMTSFRGEKGSYISTFFPKTYTLDNYIKLFADPIFHRGFLNTVLIVVVAVPTVTAFSLWVSSAIYKMHAIPRSFFRCVFYLPVVTGSVAITVVWKWILDPYNGILNQLIGTNGYNWLGEGKTALACIILILFTTSIGQPIVLYVAALGNVDNSIIEAAQVDGATKLQVFWKIKWPQIMPTTLYVLVITTINSFQCFALIQLLTRGGPLNSTMTIMYQVYDTAYRLQDFGYANAIGVVLAIIIAIFSAIQFKVAKTD